MVESKQEKIDAGLSRYTVIAPLLKPDIEAAEKRRLRNEIMLSEGISERTLRRYIAAYKASGFNGLVPKLRCDKGSARVIPEEILKEACNIKAELPQRSTIRVIKILEGEGLIEKGSISRSTLARHLANMGYSSSELKRSKGNGYASRRFQKEHRNMLWQSDLKYGPYIPDPNRPGKKIRTYMIAFIDDATRFVCHAEFYADQKLPILEDCFRKSLIKCGIPDNIYVDNGKIFISKWFRLACARLNIRHIHTQPYAPESKGKIERFNRTTEEFLAEVELQKTSTLEELNKLFRVWLEEGYNHKEHSSLDGVSPAVRFTTDSRKVRFVTPEECRDCFLWEETRAVDKTGCISLKGKVYEAGMEFIRKKVDVRYDPFALSQIEIWNGGEKKKVISPLLVGEYCGKQKKEIETTKAQGQSRLLNVLEKQDKERRKNKFGAIAFRNVKGDDSNV